MKREIWNKRNKHYKNSIELNNLLSGKELDKASILKIKEAQNKEYKKYKFIKGLQNVIDKQKEKQ